MPVAGLTKGTVVAGNYRILEEIGRGGMGIVYKAEDIKLKRPVALKFLPPHLVLDPEARERFVQEAQSVSALDHPNICNIHEIEQTEYGHMSPEQARGEAVDERTDIWSLGVVLYEKLSGSMPFKGDYDQTLIHSILHREPAPITKTRKDLPAGLGDIVAKALQKNPAERYQSMEDLLEDLQAIAEGLKPVRAKSGIFRGRVLGLKKIYVYPIMACLVLLIILAGFFFLPRHPQAFDSIAVLPVENVSGDPEQEAFCYGIHQDLIAQLSSIKAFKKVSDKNTLLWEDA